MRRWSQQWALVVLMSLSLNACIFFEDTPTQTPCQSTKTDQQLCEELGGKCNMQEVKDECGKTRIVACGCPDGETCDAGMCVSDQTCDAEAPTQAEACEAQSFECGELTISVCDDPVVFNCGMCEQNSTCVNGSCVCQEPPIDPVAACGNAQCGSVTVSNFCDDGAQVINCGVCVLGQTCNVEQMCEAITINGDGERNAYFGGVVAVRGNFMVVSEFNTFSRPNKRVLIYEFDVATSAWTKRQTLRPSTLSGQLDEKGSGTFGAALAISDDWLAIGAPGRKNDAEAADEAGAIYLYKRTQNAREPWALQQTILGERGGRLGTSLAINDKVLVAGEPGPARPIAPAIQGHLYIYRLENAAEARWEEEFKGSLDVEKGNRLGETVALSGTGLRVAVSAPKFNNVGRVWVLMQDADKKWEVDGLVEPVAKLNQMNFGAALSFAGPLLFVGSNHAGNIFELLGDNTTNVPKGEVELFDLMSKQENQFKSLRVFNHPNARSRDLFGSSLVFDGRRLLVGAPGWDGVITYGGSVVLYEVDPTSANMQMANFTLFQRDNPVRDDFFGLSVALHERWGAIGVSGAESPEQNSGIVRVLDLQAPVQGPELPPGM